MHYSPQHFFGFMVDDEVAEKLDLSEAFISYEMSYEEGDFFDGFENKYGIEPYQFTDTTYERGGYVQGLQGFDWDSIYVCFHPATAAGEKWKALLDNLNSLGIEMHEGKWSQLS